MSWPVIGWCAVHSPILSLNLHVTAIIFGHYGELWTLFDICAILFVKEDGQVTKSQLFHPVSFFICVSLFLYLSDLSSCWWQCWTACLSLSVRCWGEFMLHTSTVQKFALQWDFFVFKKLINVFCKDALHLIKSDSKDNCIFLFYKVKYIRGSTKMLSCTTFIRRRNVYWAENNFLEWFLKDHVTPKTRSNEALHHMKK